MIIETCQENMLYFDELCLSLSEAYYANDPGLALRLAEIIKQRVLYC